MRFKWIAALALSILSTAAFGQGAQFPAGTIWGNDTAAQRPGKAATVSAILDRALGSTRGSILERGASVWGVVAPGAAGLPYTSNGAGFDPSYQRLGFAGIPQGGPNSIFINPTGSSANMQAVAVPSCANDGSHGLVYVNGTGLQCATITAASLSYTAPYAGAVAETISAKLAQGISTADFGAKCDGTTDDTVAIQAAGDAAIAAGVALYIQPSANGCIVSRSGANVYALHWTSPIVIRGDGPGRSIIRPATGTPSTVHTIYLDGGGSISYQPTIIDGIFVGNPSSGTRDGGHAIVFDTLTTGHDFPRPQITNNYLQQSSAGTSWSVFVINSQTNNPVGGFRQAVIANNVIGSGISLNKVGDTISIQGNTIFGSSSNAGIYVDQVNGTFGLAGNVVISKNNMGPDAGSIIIDCAQAPMISENEIEQGATSTEANDSVVDITGANCTVTGARILSNQLQASAAAGSPKLIRVATASDTVIDNNKLATPTDYVPIVITAAASGTVIGSGNTFTGMTTQVTNGGSGTLQGITVPYGSGGASQILKRASANGAVTVAQATVGELATIAANSIIGNQSGSTANPAAFSMPSCSTAASALKWTAGSGIGCNTAISADIANVTGLATGCGTFLATPSSANLRSCLTDEVGAGAAYFVGGALGTPASGTATNFTGTASGLTAGNVTTNANMTGDVTSVGNATTLAAGNAGNLNSGTLLAARMPALTGDCATSTGAVATTCTKINGVDQTSAWSSTTPTPTCGSGSFTTASAAVQAKQMGKTWFISVKVTITTNGTCATNIFVPLPVTPASDTNLTCRENSVTGKMVAGVIAVAGGATASLVNYDNTYPGASGGIIVCGGVVQGT